MVYFSILTPYPGTRLYRRLVDKDRILTEDGTTMTLTMSFIPP